MLSTESLAPYTPEPAGVAPRIPDQGEVYAAVVTGLRDYVRKNGFDAKVQDVDDIGALKLKLGVREEFSSCHTTEVGGYIVEGHVPVEVVQRMLKERPKIAGIAVPGMPAGSPGMEVPGGRKDSYNILAFTSDGKTTVYDRR